MVAALAAAVVMGIAGLLSLRQARVALEDIYKTSLLPIVHVTDVRNDLADERKILSRTLLRGTTEAVAEGRAQATRQLLANLLNNAVAHGDPTEVIVVRTTASEHQVEIRVSNKGAPIPVDMLGRLFEPFVRPESVNPRPGLGLGLYIAAEIAKGHGGMLSVTSTAEAGTTFTTRLPRSAHSEQATLS